MAQRAHVPKFGNWDNNANVPYTQYFDNARKGRGGGKLINPNDPQENPEAFSEDAPPLNDLPVRTGSDPEAAKSKHERRLSRDDADPLQINEYPLRPDAVARKLASDSPHHRYGDRANSGEPQRRASRISGGSDRSIEQSPIHAHSHAKSGSKGGVSSPQWERRVSSEGYGHAPNTPGRSRMRPAGREDDILEKGSTVPKFGEWDESDPASAEGFTHIFEKVRNEREVGSAKVPGFSNDSYHNGHKRANSSESVSCCCFGMGK